MFLIFGIGYRTVVKGFMIMLKKGLPVSDLLTNKKGDQEAWWRREKF